MSPYLPQTEPTGDLPHLTKISRKPKPIGTECANVADAKTRIILGQEIQKGKTAMRNAKYVSSSCGPTAATARRLVDLVKNCFETQNRAVPRMRIILDAGFGNMMTVKALVEADVDGIMCIKHGHGGIPKTKILDLTKDWPCGANLTLQCKTPIRVGDKTVHPVFVFYKSGK